MILYRPVGLQELALIYDSGMKAFPARLPQQPIFYPVLQVEYARQTASSWNAKNGQLAGYVTQFKVEDEYIGHFETHPVGKSAYEELWIPAEELDEFNKHIVGHIKVLEAHFGDDFEGFIPEKSALRGKNAVEQFTLLTNSFLYKRMDFYLEIKRNHKAVFLNYPFWQTYEFKNPGLKEKVLQAIKEGWLTSFPKIPLPNPPPPPEETFPVKQADSDASVDSIEEDFTPEEGEDETDAWNDPVEEDVTPVQQAPAPARPLVHLVPEDITPIEQTNLYPQQLEDLVDDETTSEESDSEVEEKPAQEEITPPEQTEVETRQPEHPIPADPPLVRRTRIQGQHWLNRAREEPAPPRQTASHYIQGVQLGLTGKYREAINELSRAVEEDPNHAAARTSLGVAFHRLGQDDRARSSYEAALRIDPSDAEAHYFRANILYKHGNIPEAVAEYTTAIGLNPELIEADAHPTPQDRLTDYRPLPAEMYRIARHARRILELNNLLEANPRQPNLFQERASEYSRLGNYEQAIADYSSSLALQPEDANTLHLRGIAYEHIGQFDRAREDYERAVTINPQLPNEYLSRGVTFGSAGSFHQSIASLSEGIRLAPQNADGYFNRGTAYFQLGDFANAIHDFSHVIRLSPADEAAYYWRGVSYEEAGRHEEASADYRQFLALSQDENARAEVEQRINELDDRNLNVVSRLISILKNRQKTNQVESERRNQRFDLHDLTLALGERALNSTWLGNGVECYGEGAQELISRVNNNQPIDGQDFLRITSGIEQTREGDFFAFDPDSTSHWIFIRAWEGSGFYVETNDPQSKQKLQTQFPSVEEVEGATPPYEGIFIRI